MLNDSNIELIKPLLNLSDEVISTCFISLKEKKTTSKIL